MLVISLREFRTKQSFYVDKIRQGEEVILKTRDNFSMKLQPVAEDDTLMSKEEYFAMLEESQAQYDRGEYRSFKTPEELRHFLDTL